MALKYVAALLLCHYAGTPVSEENVKKVIKAVGGEVDDDIISKLVGAGSVDELLAKGLTQLAAVPAGGAAPAAAAGGAGAAPAAEVKEEKKEEPEEEEDDDMGFGLFD